MIQDDMLKINGSLAITKADVIINILLSFVTSIRLDIYKSTRTYKYPLF